MGTREEEHCGQREQCVCKGPTGRQSWHICGTGKGPAWLKTVRKREYGKKRGQLLQGLLGQDKGFLCCPMCKGKLLRYKL